jgi:putative addiction module CopG family antidote
MNLKLPKKLIKAVEKRVASGEYRSPTAVVSKALELLSEVEKRRVQKLREEVQEGVDAIERGDFIVICDEEDRKKLVADIIKRGRRVGRSPRSKKSA